MGLFDNWKNFDLKKLPGPLGKIAAAANDSYKSVVHNASTLLKGTPLGGVAHGLELASVGKTQEAAKEFAHTALQGVPGLQFVPGVQNAADAILNIGTASKKANGLNATVNANLAAAASGAAPLPPPVNPTLFRAMQASSEAAADTAAARAIMQGASQPGARGGLRSYTPAQWRAHTQDVRSVGGTQPIRQ